MTAKSLYFCVHDLRAQLHNLNIESETEASAAMQRDDLIKFLEDMEDMGKQGVTLSAEQRLRFGYEE